MRRELRPTLRQEEIRKLKSTTPPNTDEEVEIVLFAESSTTLHYEGSPLMDPNLVSDPESQRTSAGTDANYQNEDWIAIGLATDNVTNANNNEATDETGNPIGPITGSGGDFQSPDGSQAVGAVHTSVTPSRSALFFNLGNIPTDSEIIEAKLEVVPYSSSNDIGDPYNENTTANVWPSEGVTCEILMMPTETTANATWNTFSGGIQIFSDDTGTAFTLPDPNDRWWRNSGGQFPPNPIGLPQNTRRSDIPEPLNTFVSQVQINTDLAQQIDGPDGDTTAEEYYGHIGYGISGGGYIVDSTLARPTFSLSLEHWSDHTDGLAAPILVNDVIPLVQYGVQNGQKCNFLLRAKNTGDNTAAQNPDEQLTFDDIPDVTPLEFTFAHLSDVAAGPEITEIANDGTLHVVTDIQNATSVSYEWLIEIPYVAIDGLNFTTSGSATESNIVQVDVDSVEVLRGGTPSDDSNDVITYEWFLDSVSQGANPAIPNAFFIPDDAAGSNLEVRVTVTNEPNSDTFSDTFSFGTIGVDGAGSFSLIRVSPSGTDQFTPIPEGTQAQVEVQSIVGVANPRFTYQWLRSPFANSTQNGTILSETTNTSATTSSFDAPEGDWSGIPQFLTCRAQLFEEGTPVAERFISWTLADVTPPELPAQPNGVYKVDNVAIFRNCSASGDEEDLHPYEYSVLEGCSYEVIQVPTQVESCDQNTGQYGTPFGWWTDSDGNLRSVTESNLNRYYPFNSPPGGLGLIGFGIRGDGNNAGARLRTAPSQSVLNTCGGAGFQMVTRNGFNGTVDDAGTPGGKRPGDVAVWIPDFSDSNGWIIMRPLFDGPVFRGNGTRVGGGGGLVDNGGNTPTFASNYGSHDGTSCSFETGNGCIAWISKFGLNNSDAADAFLRSLDPTPIIEQDEFRNPINDTDGKLNNVYLVFFDKDLTESEANDFISRPITEFDPDYNPDSSGGPPPSPSTDLALNQITYTRNGSTWTKEQNILDSDFPVRFTSIEKPIQTFTTFGGWTSISVDVLASDYTDPDIVGWDSWLSKYGSSRGREQNFPWSIEVLASDGSRKHLYFGSCNCQGGIVSHISTDDTLHHICEPDESGEIGSFYLYENTRGAGHVFPETSLNPIAGIYGRDTAIEDGDQVIITMWNDGIDISSVFG